MMEKFIQTKCPFWLWVLLAYTVTLQFSCQQPVYHSPKGYDLTKPQLMELGKVLNEISGICYNTDNNALLSISDSKSKVIEINVTKRRLKDFTGRVVPPKSDIEDVVKVDSMIYMLSSRGIIYEVKPHSQDSTHVNAYAFWSTGDNDFETLYYDPSAKGLIMLCKTCESDNKQDIRSAYRFDLSTNKFDSSAYYVISADAVKRFLKNDHIKFNPSAAAISPITGQLFILSSAGNLLVVADTHGKIIEAYNLDQRYFPQAEGIAFAPNGTLYISNEGKFGPATLLIFPYNGNKK